MVLQTHFLINQIRDGPPVVKKARQQDEPSDLDQSDAETELLECYENIANGLTYLDFEYLEEGPTSR